MLTNTFRTNFHFGDRQATDAKETGTSKAPAPYVKEMMSFNNMMWAGYIEALKMKAAKLPENSRGLDAGCGPGGILPLLAEAVGHKGEILGLDYTPEHVAFARDVKGKYLNEKYPELHVNIGTVNK
jgi:SAM-dependent methyltransferase